jgi:hypothetical protein
MARPLRIEYPGAFYHVMHRGNAGKDIFKSIRDREKFLAYVGKAAERYEIKIHSYAAIALRPEQEKGHGKISRIR